jgi:hypothetical protein
MVSSTSAGISIVVPISSAPNISGGTRDALQQAEVQPETVTLRLASLRFFYIQVLKRSWRLAEKAFPKYRDLPLWKHAGDPEWSGSLGTSPNLFGSQQPCFNGLSNNLEPLGADRKPTIIFRCRSWRKSDGGCRRRWFLPSGCRGAAACRRGRSEPFHAGCFP